MKKFLGVLLLFAVMSLVVGCQSGPRFVDNQYQVGGMPPVIVSSDFVYVGSPSKIESKTRCVHNCQLFNTPEVKMAGDILIKAVDGKLKEAVVIQRKSLTVRGYWTALQGTKVDFGGKEYLEYFFTITDKGQVGAYTSLLEEQGYSFEDYTFVNRGLARNISDKNKLEIVYGCSESIIPESIKNDTAARKEFLRQRFTEVITLPEGY
ncbi:hypothetical protein OAN24_04800 [Pseudodesulfovibrio sp.]|nr:hypothetical protein [Pseudodesulfovibrio sp.]